MPSKKTIYFILISLIITDSFNVINGQGFVTIEYATYISAFLKYISLFIIIRFAFNSKWNDDVPKSIRNLFNLWIIWNVFELLRGAILAHGYWDWKFLMLSSVPFSLVPFVLYFGKNLKIVKYNFSFVLKYLFPFGFLLIPISAIASLELYARIMIPVNLFILFIPYVKFRWKVLIIAVAVISVLFYLGFRTNIIKVVFSFALLSLYYYRKIIPQKVFRFGAIFLFALPIILLFLGVYGKFNAFEYLSEQKTYYSRSRTGGEEKLNADTRSFLFKEVFLSLNHSGNWLLGESASGSYFSLWFTNNGGAMNHKRYGAEVGMLNTLIHDGIIGVLIYLLFLFKVSMTAINDSRNYFSKILGLFIAFRAAVFFVEEFTKYDLNFYFLWLAIGLVSTITIRNKSKEEIKLFFKNL